MRFHRPRSGIGLNKAAQTTLSMIRRLEEYVKLWELEAHMELVEERESDEAYLAAKPGEKYVLYFTDSGSVMLNLKNHPDEFVIRWLNLSTGNWESIGDWEYELPIKGGDNVKICTPMRGGWIAVIVKR